MKLSDIWSRYENKPWSLIGTNIRSKYGPKCAFLPFFDSSIHLNTPAKLLREQEPEWSLKDYECLDSDN
jgi:hypothetical protein